jgi:hypothetical protein
MKPLMLKELAAQVETTKSSHKAIKKEMRQAWKGWQKYLDTQYGPDRFMSGMELNSWSFLIFIF